MKRGGGEENRLDEIEFLSSAFLHNLPVAELFCFRLGWWWWPWFCCRCCFWLCLCVSCFCGWFTQIPRRFALLISIKLDCLSPWLDRVVSAQPTSSSSSAQLLLLPSAYDPPPLATLYTLEIRRKDDSSIDAFHHIIYRERGCRDRMGGWWKADEALLEWKYYITHHPLSL